MAFLRKHWPIFLICLVSLVALAPALRPGHAIGPWDNLRAMMEGKPTPGPFDVLQMDAALQFYGWRDLVLESWGRFEPPLWNPYQLMGTPLLANSQSGGFYPLHILLGVLHVPTWLAILLLAWFHLAWAGLGVRALVLRMGGAPHGAAVGGALFAVCPFLLSWVGLASVPTTVAWIPWALAFAHDLFDPDKRRLRSMALLGCCLGMMLLGGHLQFSAYGFMAVALLAVWQAASLKRWGGIALAVGGCVLGAMLAAPQLLPVLEYSKHSHRRNTPTEDGYAFYVRGAIKPVETAGLVFPDLLGTPNRAAPVEGQLKFGSYWPAYTKIGGNYAESALYLGPAVVLLLGLAFFRKGWRSAGAVSAVGVFGLLLALGTPINKLLYFYFPGWSSTGSPGRAAVLFVLAACAVAGWAWPRERETFSVRKPTYVLVGLALLTIAIVASMGSGLQPWNANLKPVVDAAVGGNIAFVLPIALVGLALAIGGVYFLEKSKPAFAVAGLALATLVIAGPRLVPAGEPLERGKPNPNERVANINADWQLLVGLPVVNPPNTATIQRQHDVGGYDSLLDSETFAILNEINGKDSAPEANGNMALIKPGFDKGLLKKAGVSAFNSRGEDGAIQRSFIGMAWRVVDDGPLAQTKPIDGRVLSETLSTITVLGYGPGKLTLRDRNMPGWSATVNGKPATIEPGRFRTVNLTEPENTVVFTFTPVGLSTGLWLCYIAAAITLVLNLKRAEKSQQQSGHRTGTNPVE